jgi:hypothetical protein
VLRDVEIGFIKREWFDQRVVIGEDGVDLVGHGTIGVRPGGVHAEQDATGSGITARCGYPPRSRHDQPRSLQVR